MAEVTYKTIWQAGDLQTQALVIAFWREHKLLPRGEDPRARAAQICVVATEENRLVGVSTIQVRTLAHLRAKIAMFRCAVVPEHRRGGLAGALTVRSRDILEQWAMDNPEHQIMGLGCVVQGAELEPKQYQTVWPLSGMSLVGYDGNGHQLRVVWFKNARLSIT
jgi:hypothetical protein